MLRSTLIGTALLFPMSAWAAGSSSDEPPTPTETTTTCEEGQIFDEATKACIAVEKESFLNDDLRFETLRELAYAGRYNDAEVLLDRMQNQSSDRVLTYRGFIARQQGDMANAARLYMAAIALNPDNLLARSYMAQGMVADGNIAGAKLQLAQIRMRGGAGGWPEAALDKAINTGELTSY